MKYEALYNLTLEQGGATVRIADYPEQMVMPTKGFAVGNRSEAIVSDKNSDDIKERFDTAVERLLPWAKEIDVDYLGTWVDGDLIHVEPVDVFASKDFALGVAFARGEDAIYSLADQKEIRMQAKG